MKFDDIKLTINGEILDIPYNEALKLRVPYLARHNKCIMVGKRDHKLIAYELQNRLLFDPMDGEIIRFYGMSIICNHCIQHGNYYDERMMMLR